MINSPGENSLTCCTKCVLSPFAISIIHCKWLKVLGYGVKAVEIVAEFSALCHVTWKFAWMLKLLATALPLTTFSPAQCSFILKNSSLTTLANFGTKCIALLNRNHIYFSIILLEWKLRCNWGIGGCTWWLHNAELIERKFNWVSSRVGAQQKRHCDKFRTSARKSTKE